MWVGPFHKILSNPVDLPLESDVAMIRPTRLVIYSFFVVALLIGISGVRAQSGGLSLALTAEQDIGFDCPITSALDPTGSTLWVLMDDCFDEDYSLRSFAVGSGQATNEEDDFADVLAALTDDSVDMGSTSLSIAPDGTLNVHYTDADYQPFSLSVAADGSGTGQTHDVSSLSTYSDYPEASVFNANGTQAVAIAENSVYVVDLQAGSAVLEIEIPGGNYNAFPQLSADGSRLYLTQLNNPDDPTANASTMYVFSLPDGELVGEYSLPSFIAYVSPDGQLAALILPTNDASDDELVVMDLASGTYSDILDIYEPPRHATTCLNTGDDISDVDFTVSGKLFLMDLEWLPDSSGFLTVNSYSGEGAEGDNNWVCLFNYSRLRHYTVSRE